MADPVLISIAKRRKAAKPKKKPGPVCLPMRWHIALRAADLWSEIRFGKGPPESVEKTSDTSQLVELLCSDKHQPMTRDVRDSLADLLERCQFGLRHGKGRQRPLYTRPEGGLHEPWLTALKAADPWGKSSGGPKRNSGDTSCLAELLRSDTPMPPDVRDNLADFLERCQIVLFRKGKGHQRPVYVGPSDEVIEIITAVAKYREYRKSGDTRKRDDIAAEIARRSKINLEQLVAALRSEHGEGNAVKFWLRRYEEGDAQLQANR